MAESQVTPLALAREYIQRFNNKESTELGARLLDVIIDESALLQSICRRRFDERIETRRYEASPLRRGGDVHDGILHLDDDLRAISAVTNGNGTAIDAAYLTIDGLMLALDTASAIWTSGGNDPRLTANKIAVTGTWGYGGEWISTGATLSEALADDETSLTPSDADLLEAGMVLKIDDEYLYIEAIYGSSVVVSRARHGSTAAAHDADAAISRWRADRVVRGLVLRLVSFRLQQNKSPMVGQVTVGDMAYPVRVDNLPKDVEYAIHQGGLVRRERLRGI